MQPGQWRRIRQSFTEMPYRAVFVAVFLLFILLNYVLNEFKTTLPTVFHYPLAIVIPFLILTILTPFLVALAVTLIVMRAKELKALGGASGMTAIGTFGGMLAGACPGCFAGLFPAFVGLFGLTLTLSNLPFHGLEIQVPSAALLGLSIHFLSKDITCEVKP